MKKRKFKPKWFRHEALHTTSVCLEMLYEHLENHHYFHSQINPEFNKHILAAQAALSKAYQAVGAGKENEVKKHIKVEM